MKYILESEISQQLFLENLIMDFRQERRARKLTLEAVAQMAGYEIGTISDLERKGLASPEVYW